MKFNSIANNFRRDIRSAAIHTSGVADAAAQQTRLPVRRVATSFKARQNIEHNRTHVRGFRDAKVSHEYQHDAMPNLRRSCVNVPCEDAKQPQFGANRLSSGRTPTKPSRQAFNTLGQTTTTGTPLPKGRPVGTSQITYQEPKSRGYIPYK